MTVRDLIIYNKSIDLVEKVYDLIKNNRELKNDYSLCDQIKRAAVSVSANISEGYLRTQKQFINYLHIACGSINEVITLLEIIERIYKIKTIVIREDFTVLIKQINAFAKRFKTSN